MDPKLFDILWEVYRESGSRQPIDVLSGYRSPQTNAMLRRRSRQVAEHSQHMAGKAIDAHFVDVGTGSIRDIAMRMQAGGVGFYPIGITPWVHIDSGTVRYWPRMNRDQLARLFPDGKTVFIPSDGQPMSGYDLARAEIEARGGDVLPANANGGNLFAWLFGGPHGGGSDDADESADGSSSMIASSPVGRGRSGSSFYVAMPEARVAPTSAPPPAPNSPPTVADVDAQSATSDAGADLTLRGPVAAEFIAPLPPRKPPDLINLSAATTPLPPLRPQDLPTLRPVDANFSGAPGYSKSPEIASARPPEFFSATVGPPTSMGNRDLILALLKRGQVPEVITKGIRGLPHNALAMAEAYASDPPDRSEMIAKAATLSAPLPPSRDADLPSSSTKPRPLRGAHVFSTKSEAEGLPTSLTPYGSIGAYAFASEAKATVTSATGQ